MFWVLLKPEDVEKVSWSAKNVQENACLGTSFLAFSIEPSAHLTASHTRGDGATCG